MDIETAHQFFFWCMVVNTVIYGITGVAVLALRKYLCRIHKKMFGLDEETVCESMQKYLANYKLLITFFNFVPWIVLLIIK